MREEMKKLWKKITAGLLIISFLASTVWVTPIPKVEAADRGDGWGSNQIVEFKEKNATWNLCAGERYSIKTGKRSDKWKNVTLKSDNRAVVKTYSGFNNGNCNMELQIADKPGKATLTITVKEKKKTRKYKIKVVTKKHDNPFTKVKIDATEIQKQFNIGNDDKYHTEAEAFLKKGTHTVSVKVKKNWKVTSIVLDALYYKKNITKTKKFKMPENGTLIITVENRKTKEIRRYKITLNDKSVK